MVSGVYETGSVGRVSMARGGELAVGLSGTTVRTSLGSPPVLCAVRVGVFVCGGVCVWPRLLYPPCPPPLRAAWCLPLLSGHQQALVELRTSGPCGFAWRTHWTVDLKRPAGRLPFDQA